MATSTALLLVTWTALVQAPADDPEPWVTPLGEAPPEVADSPISWACDLKTLKKSADCVFESEAQPSTALREQSANNVKLASSLADPLCDEASRPSPGGKLDPALQKMCRRDVVEAAQGCGLGGEWPLIDEKGRFTPASKPCYQSLSSVLQRTIVMARVASPCCQCMAQRGCGRAGEACYRELTSGEAPASKLQCINETCRDACFAAPTSRPASPLILPRSERPPPSQHKATHEL